MVPGPGSICMNIEKKSPSNKNVQLMMQHQNTYANFKHFYLLARKQALAL